MEKPAASPTSPTPPAGSPVVSRTVAAAPYAATRTAASAPAAADYAIVKKEIKRIAIIAGSMFAILVILSFFLR